MTQVQVPTMCGLDQVPRAQFFPFHEQSWRLTVTGEPAKCRFPGPIPSKFDLVDPGEGPETFLWLLEDHALRKTPPHHDSSPNSMRQWHHPSTMVESWSLKASLPLNWVDFTKKAGHRRCIRKMSPQNHPNIPQRKGPNTENWGWKLPFPWSQHRRTIIKSWRHDNVTFSLKIFCA